MASSQLYTPDNPVVAQSGSASQPSVGQLYTKEATPSNARLFNVSAGTPSTITSINRYGIRGRVVVNDTPPIPPIPISVILSYLYAGQVTPMPAGSKMKYWDGLQWQDIDTTVVFQ
jgi:hypothetical protein